MSHRSRVRRKLREFEKRGIFTVDAETFDGPLSWPGIFGREAPVEVEIGFGKGEFLAARAKEYPGNNLVGIEIDSTRLMWTERKLFLAGISTVRLVLGDACRLFPCLFGRGSLRSVFMNFPDPWPKKRHAKRRLIRERMIDVIIDALAPGGELIIVTDVDDYARRGLDILETRRESMKNLLGPGVIAPSLDGYPETIHEWKFRRQGRNINFLHFQRF